MLLPPATTSDTRWAGKPYTILLPNPFDTSQMTQQIAERSSRRLSSSGERVQGGLSARANSKGEAIVRQNLVNHRISSERRTSSPSIACLLPGKLAAGHAPSIYLLPQHLFGNRQKSKAERDCAASATASIIASESSDAVSEPSCEATEADGRSQAQSFTGSTSINCRQNEIREQERGCGNRKVPHVWEARSRLPFHRLPFEVQAYHLQQHHHHHRQQSHNHRCTQLSSEVSRAENPYEEDGADPAAIAESVWFPLMPPALAGEALPSSGFVHSNKQDMLLLGQKKREDSTFNFPGQELEISNSHVSQFYPDVDSSSTSRSSSSIDGATNATEDSTMRSSAVIIEKGKERGGEAIVEAEIIEESGKEEATSPRPESREAPSESRRSRQRASDSK